MSIPFRKVSLATAAGLMLALSQQPASALTTISNGIYTVHVADATGSQIGSWNAITAAGHPTGAGDDLLYSGTTVGTNFSSLRIFAAGAPLTYTFGGAGGGIDMDAFFVSEGASPFGAVGHRTTWSISGVSVVQDVVIPGAIFASSAVYHTVEITNTTPGAISIGWRNLYDWAVNDPGFDDGPSNSVETTSSTVVGTTTLEFAHTPAAGEFVRVAIAPGVSSYEPLLAIGYDPALIAALPVTLPTEYDYASWPSSVGTSFDYTTTGANVTGDSAGLSWFGRDLASSYSVASGGSVRFTQVIFGVAADEPPPGVVPEPLTGTLGGLGLAGLALAACRRRRA